MVQMANIMKKLDGTLNNLNKIWIERIDQLEKENRICREEILRLEGVVNGLISVIADKTFPKMKKEV